jgi:hypothetical protein
MFRFTVSEVAADPGALETGLTPIPPSNLANVLSAIAGEAANAAATLKAITIERFFIIGPPPR